MSSLLLANWTSTECGRRLDSPKTTEKQTPRKKIFKTRPPNTLKRTSRMNLQYLLPSLRQQFRILNKEFMQTKFC